MVRCGLWVYLLGPQVWFGEMVLVMGGAAVSAGKIPAWLSGRIPGLTGVHIEPSNRHMQLINTIIYNFKARLHSRHLNLPNPQSP